MTAREHLQDDLPRGTMRVDARRIVRDFDPSMRRLFHMGSESIGRPCHEQLGLAGRGGPCPWCRLDQAIETRRPVSSIVDCGEAGQWRFTWRPVIEEPDNVQVSETVEQLAPARSTDQAAGDPPQDRPAVEDRSTDTPPDTTRNFSHLFNASPDGVLLLNDQLSVNEANPAAAALLGVQRTELIGRNLLAFEAASRGLSGYIAEQASRGRHFGMVDHVMAGPSGRTVPVQSALRISYDPQRAVREIQVNFRHRTAPRRDNPQALLTGAALVTGAQDPEEVPELLVDWCIDSMGVAAALYFRALDHGRLELVTYAGVPEAYFPMFTALAEPGEMAERTWQTVHCLHEDNPPEEFRRLGYLKLDAAPVVWDDRPMAVVLTASRAGAAYDPAAPVLEQMAAIAGDTVERLSRSMRQSTATPPGQAPTGRPEPTAPPEPLDELAEPDTETAEPTAEQVDRFDERPVDTIDFDDETTPSRQALDETPEPAPTGPTTTPRPSPAEAAHQSQRQLVRDTSENLYYVLDGVRELLMSTAEGIDDRPAASARLHLGCQRLTAVIEALQMLSLLEERGPRVETVDLGRLCRRIWTLLHESLLRIDVTLHCEMPPRPVNAVTQPVDLAQALVQIIESLAEQLSPGGDIHLKLDPQVPRIDVVATARSEEIARAADPELLRHAAAAVGRCQGELSSSVDQDGSLVVGVRLGDRAREDVVRVLVVEDEPVLATLFEDALARSRYHCAGVLSLAETVSRLGQLTFDAIVVDIYRRPAQALSLIDQVQADRPEAAVVVTTLERDRDTLELALALGIDDSFTRPGSPQDLAAALDRALRRRRAGKLSDWVATDPSRHHPAPTPTPVPTAELPERRQAMRDLQLNTVRQMGRTLQHEINNPLAGVIGHAELLINEMNPNDPVRRRLETIIAQGERIRNVVQKLSRTRSPKVVIEPEGESRFEV